MHLIAYKVNPWNSREKIPLEKLFGKEANQLENKCLFLYIWRTHRIKTYISPERDFIRKFYKSPREYLKNCIRILKECYPQEYEKETNDLLELEDRKNKAFSAVCAIAKRRHLRVEWPGDKDYVEAGRWNVYKNGKMVYILRIEY